MIFHKLQTELTCKQIFILQFYSWFVATKYDFEYGSCLYLAVFWTSDG